MRETKVRESEIRDRGNAGYIDRDIVSMPIFVKLCRYVDAGEADLMSWGMPEMPRCLRQLKQMIVSSYHSCVGNTDKFDNDLLCRGYMQRRPGLPK